MMEIVGYTHYLPDEWKDNLHSKKVSLRSSPSLDELETDATFVVVI